MGEVYRPNSRKTKLIRQIRIALDDAKRARDYYMIDQLKHRLKLAKRV